MEAPLKKIGSWEAADNRGNRNCWMLFVYLILCASHQRWKEGQNRAQRTGIFAVWLNPIR
jgi:hypothetical protein